MAGGGTQAQKYTCDREHEKFIYNLLARHSVSGALGLLRGKDLFGCSSFARCLCSADVGFTWIKCLQTQVPVHLAVEGKAEL